MWPSDFLKYYFFAAKPIGISVNWNEDFYKLQERTEIEVRTAISRQKTDRIAQTPKPIIKPGTVGQKIL